MEGRICSRACCQEQTRDPSQNALGTQPQRGAEAGPPSEGRGGVRGGAQEWWQLS